MKFKIISSFKPTGDQPEAIDQICEGFKSNLNYQTLQEYHSMRITWS